jgi:methionyl-tRNA formyltransferase
MNIVFFGTSSFSAAILETLLADERCAVLAIVTSPDKPVGRKQIMQESAVAQVATAAAIPVHKLSSLRTSESASALTAYDADFFVVAAYGKIIPQNILDLPKHGSINVHASLLPAYRGASPIHGAILAGETQTGITIMAMDAEVDHGAMYAQHTIAIEPDECEPQLESRLAALSMKYISEDLQQIFDGSLKAVAQDHAKATFTKIITKEDGHINWMKSATEIYNQFRAYYEWPGIFAMYDGKRLKILDCQALPELTSTATPGTVIVQDHIVMISCGSGSLQIITVQLEGKQPTLVNDFLNGRPHFIGSMLS